MEKSSLQRWLADRIVAITDSELAAVGYNDRLDRMGLDSLSMIGLAAEIEHVTGHAVDEDTLSKYPTINALTEQFGE